MSLLANINSPKGKATTPNDFTLPNYKKEARQPKKTVSSALKSLLGIN